MRRKIREDQISKNINVEFFAGCILASLEYIHSQQIIHRDVKPENLVFDSKGYLYLTDFGISRVYTPNNAKDTSGTPGYLAPEVLARRNHSYGVDYYALGVILYELALGKRPYLGKTRKDIFEEMQTAPAHMRREDADTQRISDQFIDITNKLLKQNPLERLGAFGIMEIKKHPWLREVDLEAIRERRGEAPFQPVLPPEFYTFTNQPSEYKAGQDPQQYDERDLDRITVQDIFREYTIGGEEIIEEGREGRQPPTQSGRHTPRAPSSSRLLQMQDYKVEEYSHPHISQLPSQQAVPPPSLQSNSSRDKITLGKDKYPMKSRVIKRTLAMAAHPPTPLVQMGEDRGDGTIPGHRLEYTDRLNR